MALENLEKKKSQPKGDEEELSVLEKLLKIDRNVAILMVLDMLMAGVDTVCKYSSLPYQSKLQICT